MDCSELGSKLRNLLQLQHAAVAIAFMHEPPVGVARVSTPKPASCSYWKLASDGATFYTTADDHQNCTIGAYTHGVKLGPDKSDELKTTLGQMFGLNYLRQEEIPSVPHREDPFEIAAYSPLSDSPFDPQVVVIRGNAKHLMLLTEAATRAGIAAECTMLRPTCAFLPQVLRSDRATASLGCIGNRVYTDLGDDELYYAIPGPQLGNLVAELGKIVVANDSLREFHAGRLAAA